MRILHIHPSLTGGGIKTMICALSNAMNDMGHETHICTIYIPQNNEKAYNQLRQSIITHNLGKSKIGFSLKEIFTIYQFISQGNFDVVNMHGFIYYYILAILLLHNKVRFFYTIHSDAVKENAHWDQYLLPIKRFFFKHKWVHAITISKATNESFRQLYHTEGNLVFNGISEPHVTIDKSLTEPFKHNTNTIVFTHVGRITQAKNQLVLCQVFKRLIAEDKDVVLLIIGQAQDESILKQLKPYFSNRIVFLGEVDSIPYMAVSDAFCLPSLWEGMPLTLLEALATGCIPICSPVGGIPEVIKDGLNGFLSDDSSFDSYYKTICKFLETSKEQRNIIRDNALQSFQNFKIENTASQYIKLYESHNK